jgi:hypothetical protein
MLYISCIRALRFYYIYIYIYIYIKSFSSSIKIQVAFHLEFSSDFLRKMRDVNLA